jgi:hypothetical protein
MLAASSRNYSEVSDQTLLYFGWLPLFIYLATPAGFLIEIQTSYIFKNQLHATAPQILAFPLVTAKSVLRVRGWPCASNGTRSDFATRLHPPDGADAPFGRRCSVSLRVSRVWAADCLLR